MADNKLLQQMLERLVNEDTAAAEELFHEYVVAKSREIYQDLIESEISEEEDKEEDEDDKEVDESAESDDDEEVEENFEDIAFEAEPEMGGDPTDDLEGDLDAEAGDEGEAGSEEEIMQDLGSIIDELQAKFDALTGAEEEQGEFGGEEGGDEGEDEMKDAFEPELETVREYVEKVPAGHGAEKKGAAEQGADTKSVIDNMKNDMGGTTANILGGKEDSSNKGTAGGLAGNKAKEDNAGNINVPGGKAGGAFSTKEPGHGAEKKGAAEQADKGAGSLFRGRR
jgi:hypothetical protein